MELTGRPLMEVQVLGFSRLADRVLKSAGGAGRLFLSPGRPAHGSAQGH